MTRGRRPEGARLLRRPEGAGGAKGRPGGVLGALAGGRTVADACRRLGLSERRFYALRDRALQAALRGLEPRPAGRPARPGAAADARVATLEATIQELRLDLRAA